MVEMKKAEFIFIPSPGLSHLVSTVEMAKLLLDRDDRLAITTLIMTLPNDAAVGSYIQKTSSDLNKSPRLRFLNLPGVDEESSPSQIIGFARDFIFIDEQTDHVREAISGIVQQSSAGNESQLAGLVLDIFCTKFIDVGKEFGLPSYLFHTSSASGLGLAHCLMEMSLEGNQDLTQFVNSDVELSVPNFTAPVPAKVLPSVLIEKGGPVDFLGYFKRIPELSGIMVNTFYELESHAIDSLNSHGKIPKVYAVGPILNQSNQSFNDDDDDVKKWLDDQPENSVVFLCFGTYGSLDVAQVKEIALALENGGFRFLWSLRKPTTKFATGNENLEQVLPEGFLERTRGVGKVIGWAPQVAALSHAAVGGFVSHCGWNSTLESVWYGVPVAAFPMYAEQHMNAFELVTELEMAEAITLDYHMDFTGEKPPKIVGWEEIAAAIKRVMAAEGGSGVRGKVKEMHSKARAALVEGGSSYNAQNAFINDVVRNIA